MVELETDKATTKPSRIVRKCILCDADDAETLFTFTHDFLTQVRESSPEWLAKIGWTPDETSSIVQCKRCGAKYIRDVFTNFEENKVALTESDVINLQQTASSKKLFSKAEKQLWILYNLLYQTHRHLGRDIALLDYGAGSGTWCNTARAMGIIRVFAYEPFNPYAPHLYSKFNFPGIYATRSWDEIASHGPFDAIMCNAVFEHLSNPRENVQRMFDHLNPGGFLYLHNPFMDLDNELGDLQKAQKITKAMPTSHYHPGHVNYLTPNQFRKFVRSFGFNIVPLSGNAFQMGLKKQLKNLVKSALIQIGLYHGKEFLLQKP